MPFDSSDRSTKLKIVLDIPGDSTMDNPDNISTVMEASFEDCSVHAWFSLFERILKINGFSDYVIMAGGAQLAFNEFREQEEMRKVAKEYDLVLLEDCHRDEDEVSISNFQETKES